MNYTNRISVDCVPPKLADNKSEGEKNIIPILAHIACHQNWLDHYRLTVIGEIEGRQGWLTRRRDAHAKLFTLFIEFKVRVGSTFLSTHSILLLLLLILFVANAFFDAERLSCV